MLSADVLYFETPLPAMDQGKTASILRWAVRPDNFVEILHFLSHISPFGDRFVCELDPNEWHHLAESQWPTIVHPKWDHRICSISTSTCHRSINAPVKWTYDSPASRAIVDDLTHFDAMFFGTHVALSAHCPYPYRQNAPD